MEDIVAVALELESGSRLYLLTWGRIQSATDPAPLEKLVFEQSDNRVFSEKLVRARLCHSLQEASSAPFSTNTSSACARRKSLLATTIPNSAKKSTKKCGMAKSCTILVAKGCCMTSLRLRRGEASLRPVYDHNFHHSCIANPTQSHFSYKLSNRNPPFSQQPS